MSSAAKKKRKDSIACACLFCVNVIGMVGATD